MTNTRARITYESEQAVNAIDGLVNICLAKIDELEAQLAGDIQVVIDDRQYLVRRGNWRPAPRDLYPLLPDQEQQ